MIKLNGHLVNVTIFPDKTSQVWKLSNEILFSIEHCDEYHIYWEFQNEGEIFQIIQLIDLVQTLVYERKLIILECPYLPYARQDKEIYNNSCFALHTFCSLFSSIAELRTFDVHNPSFFANKNVAPFDLVNYLPYEEINKIIKEEEINLVLYPDKGASKRYPQLSENNIHCSAEKVRDQLTGEITGISIPNIVDGLNIIVVDDLCDGGRTFVELAKVIKEHKPAKLILYVSHGIFSKGVDIIYIAGYTKIYTKNGLVDRLAYLD